MKMNLLAIVGPIRGLRLPSIAGLSAILAIGALLGGCAAPMGPAGTVTMPAAVVISAPAAPASGAGDASGAIVTLSAAEALGPVDPMRPDVRVDLNDRSAQIDLWERVRQGFAMPDLDTPLVKSSEQWYSTRPDYVARMTERGSRYLFHIVDELERRGMPTELALLPFVESAFNPQAMSSASASGMWQFIASTGRDFSLKQNIFRDDRRDVIASTRAALDYLQRLHDMFGDWQLALAAYNCGEGNVQRAISRNQRAGLPTDYLSLRLPVETQGYVPKLQAVKNIISRPDAYALTLPALSNHPYFLSVPITRDIDVDIASQLAGMTSEEFKNLNPQMNKPVILASGTPQVLLPYDNANMFLRTLASHRGPVATWTAWVAPKTMRPDEAAREVGMSEADLREVNRIPPRMLVKAGSTLLVPRKDGLQADVSNEVADNAVMTLAPDAPPPRRLSIKAGRRDTLASVAGRYHVTTAQLAQWNNLHAGSPLKAGQPMVVFVAAHAPTRAAPTVASKSAPVLSAAQRTGTRTIARPVARAATRTVVAARKPAGRAVVVAKKAPVKTARGGGGGNVRVTRATK